MQLQTAEQTFPSRDLPNAYAGELDMIANRTWYPPRSTRMQQRLQPYGHQAELDLQPPHVSAELIDLRQLHLFSTENHHDHEKAA